MNTQTNKISSIQNDNHVYYVDGYRPDNVVYKNVNIPKKEKLREDSIIPFTNETLVIDGHKDYDTTQSMIDNLFEHTQYGLPFASKKHLNITRKTFKVDFTYLMGSASRNIIIDPNRLDQFLTIYDGTQSGIVGEHDIYDKFSNFYTHYRFRFGKFKVFNNSKEYGTNDNKITTNFGIISRSTPSQYIENVKEDGNILSALSHDLFEPLEFMLLNNEDSELVPIELLDKASSFQSTEKIVVINPPNEPYPLRGGTNVGVSGTMFLITNLSNADAPISLGSYNTDGTWQTAINSTAYSNKLTYFRTLLPVSHVLTSTSIVIEIPSSDNVNNPVGHLFVKGASSSNIPLTIQATLHYDVAISPQWITDIKSEVQQPYHVLYKNILPNYGLIKTKTLIGQASMLGDAMAELLNKIPVIGETASRFVKSLDNKEFKGKGWSRIPEIMKVLVESVQNSRRGRAMINENPIAETINFQEDDVWVDFFSPGDIKNPFHIGLPMVKQTEPNKGVLLYKEDITVLREVTVDRYVLYSTVPQSEKSSNVPFITKILSKYGITWYLCEDVSSELKSTFNFKDRKIGRAMIEDDMEFQPIQRIKKQSKIESKLISNGIMANMPKGIRFTLDTAQSMTENYLLNFQTMKGKNYSVQLFPTLGVENEPHALHAVFATNYPLKPQESYTSNSKSTLHIDNIFDTQSITTFVKILRSFTSFIDSNKLYITTIGKFTEIADGSWIGAAICACFGLPNWQIITSACTAEKVVDMSMEVINEKQRVCMSAPMIILSKNNIPEAVSYYSYKMNGIMGRLYKVSNLSELLDLVAAPTSKKGYKPSQYKELGFHENRGELTEDDRLVDAATYLANINQFQSNFNPNQLYYLLTGNQPSSNYHTIIVKGIKYILNTYVMQEPIKAYSGNSTLGYVVKYKDKFYKVEDQKSFPIMPDTYYEVDGTFLLKKSAANTFENQYLIASEEQDIKEVGIPAKLAPSVIEKELERLNVSKALDIKIDLSKWATTPINTVSDVFVAPPVTPMEKIFQSLIATAAPPMWKAFKDKIISDAIREDKAPLLTREIVESYMQTAPTNFKNLLYSVYYSDKTTRNKKGDTRLPTLIKPGNLNQGVEEIVNTKMNKIIDKNFNSMDKDKTQNNNIKNNFIDNIYGVRDDEEDDDINNYGGLL